MEGSRLTNLFESYLNLFKKEEKEKYVDSVWNIIQDSYASIGGIKGNGFKSKEDMIENIPFWKLVRRNGEIVAVVLYKDKEGRKSVACGTNGKPIGKEELGKLLKDDIKRAYREVSGPMLKFVLKTIGEKMFLEYAISIEETEKLLKEPLRPVDENNEYVHLYPNLKDYFYEREIGGEMVTKICLGVANKKIY